MAKPKPSPQAAEADKSQDGEPVVWVPTRFETIRGGLLVCVEHTDGKAGWTWSVRRIHDLGGSTIWTAPARAESAAAAQEAALRKADALSSPARNSRSSLPHT